MVAVAVTGIGIRCAGSADSEAFWKNVVSGHSAVATVTGVEIGDSICRVGGQIESVPLSGYGDQDDRLLQLLIGVADEAVDRSSIGLRDIDPARIGIVLGQCQGSLVDDTDAQFMHAHVDALAGHLGVTGPRTVLSTACTAGAAALALAAERIVCGDADVMIAGGIDILSGFSWRGFTSLQSLSPEGCAAYSRSDGLVLGEGAGIFVLERLDTVLAQGRQSMTELIGWGFSADAHHITAPDPSGRGAVMAMERAVARSGLDLDAIGYVCGHGTGTHANDDMEVAALKLAFGARAPQVPLSSIKPMIGHTLGAAGAIEAAAAVFALRDGLLPPTINFDTATETDLDFVPNNSRSAALRTVMSNNYAFGGNNSSLVFGRAAASPPQPAAPAAREVRVTGIGVLAGGASGFQQFSDALFAGRTGLGPWNALDPGHSGFTTGVEMPPLTPRGVTTPAEWRHLDPLSRLALSVARQAINDSGIKLTAADLANVAMIYGSGTGPVSAIRRFQNSVTEGDPSPVHFPNTVYTATPGHLCKALGLHGPTTTFTSGGLAGMHALEYAALLISRGEVDRAVVVAAEELSEWHLAAGGSQRSYMSTARGIPFQRGSDGANLGAAGVAFLLESAECAAARQKPDYGTIVGCAVGGDASNSVLPDPRATVWDSVVRRAVERAGVGVGEIGFVACAANGAAELDSIETGVIARTLGSSTLVSAPKSVTGETLGASGAIAVVAGLAALRRQQAPPTADLTDPVGANRVHHVIGDPMALTADFVAANAFSLGGNYATMILGR